MSIRRSRVISDDSRVDPRVHEIAIGPYVGIGRIEILWVSKGEMRMFCIFYEGKEAEKRGLMDAETMPPKRLIPAEKT